MPARHCARSPRDCARKLRQAVEVVDRCREAEEVGLGHRETHLALAPLRAEGDDAEPRLGCLVGDLP
eukprot:8977445-Lingulodinium_polyedra.AAC.1